MSVTVIHAFGVEIVRSGVRWTIDPIDGGLSVWPEPSQAPTQTVVIGPDPPPIVLNADAPLAFFASRQWIGVKRSD